MGRYEDHRAEFDKEGVKLAGVSVDPIDVSQDLATRLKLGYPILADEGGAMSQAYGVWHADRKIALPAVIVIDKDGVVRWRFVSPSIGERPREEDVLEVVKKLPR